MFDPGYRASLQAVAVHYVVREYCGHGVGQEMHEEPQVLHYGRPGEGAVLQEG
ncbi:M24 family metallopeptidase, partial [Klebsiella pneumoniae]|uniref:M24 family metallopeptidase n=1 Tax=Klebsiella pneumoniae TaxID=573 RepID=UPI0028122DEC